MLKSNHVQLQTFFFHQKDHREKMLLFQRGDFFLYKSYYLNLLHTKCIEVKLKLKHFFFIFFSFLSFFFTKDYNLTHKHQGCL